MPEGSVNIVLASASPRRHALLNQVGIVHRVVPADVEERPAPSEAAEHFTLRAASTKAVAVAGRQAAGTWVLAADTTVLIGDRLLGKPRDAADAVSMLELLSGRAHRVLTAVVLLKAPAEPAGEHLAETTVRFRSLTSELIRGYVETGEPLDKAGAYGIQGRGAMLVTAIEGSYTNVVGLPLAETVQLLEDAGAWVPFSRNAEDAARAAMGGGA